MTKKHGFSQIQIIAIGFFLIIALGTLLLMLPWSTKEGSTSLLDAAFTAVSASCVTGLIVKDTYTHWTLFGQLVILSMIQIGGLGFASIGIAFSLAFRRRINLSQSALLQESVSSLKLAGAVKLVKLIVKGTILFEGLGALILAIRFVPEFGFFRGLYFAVFHSVSAFCNGGFDLMGYKESYSSLSSYAGDGLVIITVTSLILIGGIGFIVWDDILKNWKNPHKYMLHTKIVFLGTGILVIGGTLAFWFIERNSTISGMNTWQQFLASLFSAVTPRTAGFNSVDTDALSPAGKLLTIAFMFIGGCPGSTAGGIKTATVVVLIVYTISSIRNEKQCCIFDRSVSVEVVSRACMVLVLNLSLAVLGSVIIMALHPEIEYSNIMFEVFSAIGTAGMSTGITRDLNTASRLVIMFLMYLGRIGSMTFALSFVTSKRKSPITYPEGKITVG